MPEYLSPGVYIEEVNTGPRPIEGVGTAVAAFVGVAPFAPAKQPVLVTNWSQYVENFCKRERRPEDKDKPVEEASPWLEGYFLSHAVYGYFQNGGGRCWVWATTPSAKAFSSRTPRAAAGKDDATGEAKEPSTSEVAAPAATLSSATLIGNEAARTGIKGMAIAEDVTMICCPDLMTLDKDGIKAVQDAMIEHCEQMKDRVAILDAPRGLPPQDILKWRLDDARFDSKYAALYYPWISVSQAGKRFTIPPSGHIAGVYARSDNERGVHKAPANEVIRGVLETEKLITTGEQNVLNPEGINCIRAFSGRGIRIWGARTLSKDAAWRYINVRRLFNFVEESIEQGTQWVVFEPNDPNLWARVKRDVGAFLTTVWRDGALFGRTADEAFFVKCDEELNPPESRDQGKLIIEIGLAPVKPAEFVIFRVSQLAGGGS